MTLVPLFFILHVLCCFHISDCVIRDLHYESREAFVDDNVQGFGMAEGGLINVKYGITSNNTADHPSTTFFLIVVVTKDQYDVWYHSRLNKIDYSSEMYYTEVQELCLMPSMFRKRLHPSNGTFEHVVMGTNLYYVVLMQCFPQSMPIIADFTLELTNPTSEGCCSNHLPIEAVMDINIAVVEIFFYSLMLISFLAILASSEKEAIKPMHFLLLVVVSISALSSVLNYISKSMQNDNGRVSNGIEAIVYVLRFLETTSFKFTVLLLGMGWNFIREDIARLEKTIISFLLVFFLIIGLVQIPCLGKDVDDMSSGCQALSLIEYVISGLILLSTIIALNYSVSHIRAIISNLNWYPSMPMLYSRLKQYNQFRNIFLVLLIIPTVMYMIEVTLLTWRQKWIANLGQSMVKMVFLCYTGAIFIPLDNTLLSRCFNGSFNSN